MSRRPRAGPRRRGARASARARSCSPARAACSAGSSLHTARPSSVSTRTMRACVRDVARVGAAALERAARSAPVSSPASSSARQSSLSAGRSASRCASAASVKARSASPQARWTRPAPAQRPRPRCRPRRRRVERQEVGRRDRGGCVREQRVPLAATAAPSGPCRRSAARASRGGARRRRPRRATGSPLVSSVAGDAGEARSAAVDDGSARPRRRGHQPPDRPRARRRRRRRAPAGRRAVRDRRRGASAHSERSTTRASTAPFQRLRSSVTAASCGSAPAAASARCEVRNATPRARAPPLARLKRAWSRVLAHRGHVLDPRGGDEQPRRRVALAERPEALELLGQLEGQRARPDDRVDALAARRGPPARGAPRRARRARRGTARSRPVVDLEPGGHPVAAELHQLARRRAEAGVQVVGGDAAARAAP